MRRDDVVRRTHPNFEFDSRVVNVNGLSEEGGTDCALLVLVELSLDEAQHQRGLADGRLAQQHQLELADFALCAAVGALDAAAAASLIVRHDSTQSGGWNARNEN